MWVIFELFFSSVEMLYFLAFPVLMLGCKHWVKPFYLVLYFIFSMFACSLAGIYNFFGYFSMSTYIFIIIIFNITFIVGSFPPKLLWGYFPILITSIIDIVVLLVSSTIMNISTTKFSEQTSFRVFYVVCSKAIEIAIIVLTIKNKEKFAKVNSRLLILAVCIPLAIILLLIELFVYQQPNAPAVDPFESIFIVVLLILLIYGIYAFIAHLANKEQKKQLAVKLAEQKKSQEELIKTINKLENQTTEQLQKVWQVAKNNNVQNLDPVIDEFMRMNSIFKNVFKTGIEVIDIVLTSKETLAADIGIGIELCEVNIKSLDADFMDASLILYNALDYMIERVDHIDDQECYKLITVQLEQTDVFFTITMECPVNSDEYESQIAEASLHLIHLLVDRNMGTLSARIEELFLTFEVMLPL